MAAFDRGSVTIARVRGIPVRLHWTLLLAIPYLAVALATQFRSIAALAGVEAPALVLPPLAWGGILALALFVSVLVHELAHAFVAMAFGGRVRSITLMLVGGVSQIASQPRGRGTEAIVAVAGPIASLALGAIAFALFAHAAAWAPDVQMGLFYLASANAMLFLFNLLPAFPMDGGRILRSLLALRLSPARATAIAARTGMVAAALLALFGLLGGGFLLVLIAVFVWAGARAELAAGKIHAALDGLHAVDLVPPRGEPMPTVDARDSLEIAQHKLAGLDHLAVVVLGDDGRPIGIVRAEDIAAVPPVARAATTAGELAARPEARCVVVPADASANTAIEQAAEAGADYEVIVDRGTLVGLVDPEAVARTVALQLLAAT